MQSLNIPRSLVRAAESSATFRALFAARSLTVFPLRPVLPGPSCSCAAGASCEAIGKHPAIVWSDLERGEQIIASDAPDCGYGVATGSRSGFFAIDVDGPEAHARLLAMEPMPDTFTVKSPSGPERYHLWLTAHSTWRVKTSAGQLGRGLDVRGEGGYVVAPGSPHRRGGFYEVTRDTAIAPAPAWLLDWPGLRARARVLKDHGAVAPVPIADMGNAYGQARIRNAVEYLRTAPLSVEGQGGRTTFFRVCCCLVRRQRLPLDLARGLIADVYNPRLLAAGTTTWDLSDIEDRLESARDTASTVPPGDVFTEEHWTQLNAALSARNAA